MRLCLPGKTCWENGAETQIREQKNADGEEKAIRRKLAHLTQFVSLRFVFVGAMQEEVVFLFHLVGA